MINAHARKSRVPAAKFASRLWSFQILRSKKIIAMAAAKLGGELHPQRRKGRWIGVHGEDLALYDEVISKLPADYADWLQNGGPDARASGFGRYGSM